MAVRETFRYKSVIHARLTSATILIGDTTSGITKVYVNFDTYQECPSQDEAVARQLHPRLEKQTLIEERISGHLRVVQPSSENKH